MLGMKDPVTGLMIELAAGGGDSGIHKRLTINPAISETIATYPSLDGYDVQEVTAPKTGFYGVSFSMDAFIANIVFTFINITSGERSSTMPGGSYIGIMSDFIWAEAGDTLRFTTNKAITFTSSGPARIVFKSYRFTPVVDYSAKVYGRAYPILEDADNVTLYNQGYQGPCPAETKVLKYTNNTENSYKLAAYSAYIPAAGDLSTDLLCYDREGNLLGNILLRSDNRAPGPFWNWKESDIILPPGGTVRRTGSAITVANMSNRESWAYVLIGRKVTGWKMEATKPADLNWKVIPSTLTANVTSANKLVLKWNAALRLLSIDMRIVNVNLNQTGVIQIATMPDFKTIINDISAVSYIHLPMILGDTAKAAMLAINWDANPPNLYIYNPGVNGNLGASVQLNSNLITYIPPAGE